MLSADFIHAISENVARRQLQSAMLTTLRALRICIPHTGQLRVN